MMVRMIQQAIRRCVARRHGRLAALIVGLVGLLLLGIIGATGSEAQTSTAVRVKPASMTFIGGGDPFAEDLEVWIEDVSNMGGYEFILEMDPAVAGVADGECVWLPDSFYSYLEPGGRYLHIVCTDLEPGQGPPSVSGSDIGVRVTVHVMNFGETDVTLSESILYESTVTGPGTPVPQIPHQAYNGSISVIECPDQNGDHIIDVSDLTLMGSV